MAEQQRDRNRGQRIGQPEGIDEIVLQVVEVVERDVVIQGPGRGRETVEGNRRGVVTAPQPIDRD